MVVALREGERILRHNLSDTTHGLPQAIVILKVVV